MSKPRSWNDDCTGRTCNEEPAIPLEPAASSAEDAATTEASQMERNRKKTCYDKLHRTKVKVVVWQDDY